jgi:hypothetical protein
VADSPWETRIGGYNTIILEGDKFRMWSTSRHPTTIPPASRAASPTPSHRTG